MQEDEYLTVVEVAKLTRTTPATVRYWRNQGTGPKGFICGRHILYARSDVAQWLEDLRKHG
jgi:excisionase family DNA binding protein